MVGRLLEGPLASGGTWEGTEAGQGGGEMVAGEGPGRRGQSRRARGECRHGVGAGEERGGSS